MSNETGVTTVYAGGGVLGDAWAVPLSDPDGDGTWTGLANFPTSGGAYIFLKNPSWNGDWNAKEDISGQSCAVGQYNDRLMPALTSDTTVLHCFGTCYFDGTCSPPVTCPPNAVCENYATGIDSDRGFTSATGSSTCPGTLLSLIHI